jgi:hypothetical protein
VSEKTTTRNINIKATDSSSNTMLGMIKTMRQVASEIRVLITLMQMLAAAEDLTAVGALKWVRMGLMAVTGAMAIATTAQMTAGGSQIVPMYQTMPGEFKTIRATGPAIVHKGELIGRPQNSTQGGGIGGVTINMNDVALNTKRDLHEMIEDLGTEVYYTTRRYK